MDASIRLPGGIESGYGIARMEFTPGRPYPGYWRIHLSTPSNNWTAMCTVISNAGTNPWDSWTAGIFASVRWIDTSTMDLTFHDAGNGAATIDPPKISLVVF